MGTKEGKISSFVRVNNESSIIVEVFDKVEFLVISEDILFFNGDPGEGYWAGGGFGTLIKGLNVEGDNSDGSWVTQPIGESNMTAEEWLLKNFGEDGPLLKNFGEDVPPAELPTRAPTRLSTNNPTKKLAKDSTEEPPAALPTKAPTNDSTKKRTYIPTE